MGQPSATAYEWYNLQTAMARSLPYTEKVRAMQDAAAEYLGECPDDPEYIRVVIGDFLENIGCYDLVEAWQMAGDMPALKSAYAGTDEEIARLRDQIRKIKGEPPWGLAN